MRLLALLVLAAVAAAQDTAKMRASVEALRAPKVAWRGIEWKTCLLDGLRAARAESKPVLLWIFIDRPVDDARC